MTENDTPGRFNIKKIKPVQGLEQFGIEKQIGQRKNSQNPFFFRQARLFEDLQKMAQHVSLLFLLVNLGFDPLFFKL